jgi:hypothetical protein
MAGQHRRVDEDDDDRQWPSWLMILGLFAVLVAFWWVSAAVLVSYWTVGRLFCAFAFGGNLFHGAWTIRLLGMSRGYWFMFNLLFIGPVLFCCFFAMNGILAHDPEHFIVPAAYQRGLKRHWIEQGALPPWALESPGKTVLVHAPKDTAGLDIQVLTISDGAFGLQVMSWQDPVYTAPD